MPVYEVSGIFKPGETEREFTKEIEADNEDVATERIYTDLGSRHSLKRTQIDIESVEEAVEVEG
ncbi:MAG: 50S ribosomal protein L18Ae [Halobacteria archaeon]